MIAQENQPKYKALNNGLGALSSVELIQIIIGVESKQLNELNLSDIARMSITELSVKADITTNQAIKLLASLALSSRKEVVYRKKISSSKDINELLRPYLEDLDHEQFYIVLCNRANHVIKTECLSKGGISGTVVDIGQILKLAALNNAQAVFVSHNHPSGNLRPSEADNVLTKRIKDALRLMDVCLLDHVIISQLGFYSYADEGNL
jgi:DNA repair protein RadC